MAKERRLDSNGKTGFSIVLFPDLLDNFQIAAKKHSINTGINHSARSLLIDLMQAVVDNPEILKQVESKHE